MKSFLVGNDEREFEVTCHECNTTHTLKESELFTVSIEYVPIPIGAFDCPSCKKICVIRNGDQNLRESLGS